MTSTTHIVSLGPAESPHTIARMIRTTRHSGTVVTIPCSTTLCCKLHIQRRFHIRDSLIPTTFVTFIVLFYVKVLNTSFALLLPVRVYNTSGNFSTFLYKDGEIPYFGKKHLPYAMLAVLMMLFFNVRPLVLLVVYPCTCFQAHCRNQGVSTFVDAFHGYYKTQPRDCRYYSAIHFLCRILYLLFLGVYSNAMVYPIGGLMFLSLATATTVSSHTKLLFTTKWNF